MLRNIWKNRGHVPEAQRDRNVSPEHRKPLGLMIILMVLMVLLPVGVMAAPVGKISHLEGEADVTTPDGKTAIVKPADPISVGDILRTKAKSKVEVTFLDGNTIFLAERSRLKISEYEHKEESKSYFDLFRGKTRVVVNNLAKKSAIELHTPTAVAGVRGTIWIGTYENGVSEFYFEQGEGYGYTKSRPKEVVTIKAGQTMTVTAPDQPPIVRPAPEYEINRLRMETSASQVQQRTQETPPSALPGGEQQGPSPTPPAPPGVDQQGPSPTPPAPPGGEQPSPPPPPPPPPPVPPPPPPVPPPPPPVPLDTTAPVLSFTGAPPDLTNQSSATFTVSSSEAGTNFSYSLDGSAYSSPSGSGTIILPGLPEGSHTLTVKGTDAAGNTSPLTSWSWTVDTTAPTVALSTATSSRTNQPTATFTVSSTSPDPATSYSYSTNGINYASVTGNTISFAGLSEGSHTVYLKGTDAAGNVTTTPASFSWTTDYTAPTVALSTATPSLTNQPTATFTVSSTSPDPATSYSYSTNGINYASVTGNTISLAGLSEGSHTVYLKGTDAAGNTSTAPASFSWTVDTIAPPVTLTAGNPASSTSSTSATFTVSSTEAGTTFSYSLDGTNYSPATNGTITLSGLSQGQQTLYVKGTDLAGNVTSVTPYTWTVVTTAPTPPSPPPSVLSGQIDYDYNDCGLYNNTEGIYGVGDTYGGSVSWPRPPWSGKTSLSLMGQYNDSESYAPPYLWNAPIYSYYGETYITPDGGWFWGLTGGVWKDGKIDAKVYSLYIDPSGNAGILKGSLTGAYDTELSEFKANGTWTPTVLATDLDPASLGSLTYSPDFYFNNLTSDSGGFSAEGSYINVSSAEGPKYSIPGQDWGIWQILAAGDYGGTTSAAWNLSLDYDYWDEITSSLGGTYTQGTKWLNERLAGTTFGYGADIASAPTTWISVGETMGTFFNPTDSTWQAVQTGVWIETNKFLAMAADTSSGGGQAKLAQLNIPAIEVGRVNLTGSDSNFTLLSMNDVTFFAPSTGKPPQLWATGNVNGSYIYAPSVGIAIPLSGGGLNADFTFITWDTGTGKWLSTIDNGSGGFNGSTAFYGAGAGTGATSGSGTITGTAAGIVK